ncbi:prefoldin subunit alpha [Candidatus Woesearchaeota archaeon]|nr:prefoldin subunit alpha [Candidatus Woesearchaeota archaeon]
MDPNTYPQTQELQQGMQQIQEQLQLLLQQKAELDHLTDALQELKKRPQKQDVLVPFGAGIYLKAEIKDPTHVLLNVGAGVTVEKDINATLVLIEKQAKELHTIEGSMQEELAHVRQQLQFLQMSGMQQKE